MVNYSAQVERQVHWDPASVISYLMILVNVLQSVQT